MKYLSFAILLLRFANWFIQQAEKQETIKERDREWLSEIKRVRQMQEAQLTEYLESISDELSNGKDDDPYLRD